MPRMQCWKLQITKQSRTGRTRQDQEKQWKKVTWKWAPHRPRHSAPQNLSKLAECIDIAEEPLESSSMLAGPPQP